jgi:glycerophosphoryl diester phosphodiesterase
VRFFDAHGPQVFAHRGGAALAPENTLAAFDRGMAAGADGLELDVHLSADSELVVLHDSLLDRTTNATGPVARRTAAELARVDAGWHFTDVEGRTPFRGQGVGVPRLRDVLCRHAGVRVIIEMKVDSPEMGRALAGLVREMGAADRVCAAGAGSRCVGAARAALPEMASSATVSDVRWALYAYWIGWAVRNVPYGGYQIPEQAGRTTVVSPRFIRLAHRFNLPVQVWTVDEAADMDRLLDWGVDGLITNRPDLAVERRNAFLGRSGTGQTPLPGAQVAAGPRA